MGLDIHICFCITSARNYVSKKKHRFKFSVYMTWFHYFKGKKIWSLKKVQTYDLVGYLNVYIKIMEKACFVMLGCSIWSWNRNTE